MKNRFTSTRIISGLLSAAMVVTMAPQTALSSFAAEPILTESVSGGEDGAFFDAEGSSAGVTDGTAEVMPESAKTDNGLTGGEEADDYEALNDLVLDFSDNASTAANEPWRFPYANGSTSNSATANAVYTSRKMTIYPVDDPSNAYTSKQVGMDATKDFSFVVSPDKGYALPSTFIVGLSYGKYSSSAANARVPQDIEASALDIKKLEDTVYDATDFNRGSYVVTIPKNVLADIKKDVYIDKANGTQYGREVIVRLAEEASTVQKYTGITFNAINGAEKANISDATLQMECDAAGSIKFQDVIENHNNLSVSGLVASVAVFDENDKVVKGKFTLDHSDTTNYSDGITGDTEEWIVLSESNVEITIDESALAEAYNKKYKMSIIVDGGNAANVWNVSYTGVNEDYVKIQSVTRKQNEADSSKYDYSVPVNDTKPTSVTKDGDLYLRITAADGEANRTFIVNARKKSDLSTSTPITSVGDASSTTSDGTSYYKVGSVGYDIDLEVISYEKVGLGASIANAKVYDTAGTEITYDSPTTTAVTGEKYGLFVVPAPGYAVGNVNYATRKMSQEATAGTGAGLIEVPASAVNATMTVRPVVTAIETQGAARNVALTTESSDAVTVKAVTPTSNPTLATTSADNAHVGEPFYFQVQGNNTDDSTIVDKVTVVMDGATRNLKPIAVTPAVEGLAAAAAIYWYVIPSVTANATIEVTAAASTGQKEVTAPDNKNVVLTINDRELSYAAPGNTMKVAEEAALSVTAKAASDNIKITYVGYKVGANDEQPLAGAKENSTLSVSEGTWSIQSGVITDNTIFTVYTSEYVSTDEFVTVFNGGNIVGDGYDSNGIAKLATLKEDGKTKVDITSLSEAVALNVHSQSLKLAVSNTTLAFAGTKFYTWTDSKKTALNTALSGTLTYSLANKSNIATIVNTSGSQTLQGAAVGSDTLVAKLTMARGGTNLAGNEKIYTADLTKDDDMTAKLPIEVVARYSDEKIKVNTPGIYVGGNGTKTGDKYVETLSIVATDNITGETTTAALDAETNLDIASITWTFEPDTTNSASPTHVFAASTGGDLPTVVVGVEGETTATGAMFGTVQQKYKIARVAPDSYHTGNTVGDNGLVYVTSTIPETIRVAATLVYKDKTGTKVALTGDKAASFTSVADDGKKYVAIVRVDGDTEKYNVTGTSNQIDLGLGQTDPKEITLSYDVYEDLTASQNYNITSKTEADIRKSIEAGDLGEVTGVVSFGAISLTSNDKKLISLTGEGPWTIKAIKSGTTTGGIEMPSVYVDGVEVLKKGTGTGEINVTTNVKVDQRVAAHQLNLITYDIDSEKNVSELTVSDAWFDGYEHSVIEGAKANAGLVYTAPEYGKSIGTALAAVGKGVTVTLPSQGDLVGTIPAGRVLVGWAEMEKFEAASSPDITTMKTSTTKAGNVISTTGNSYILNCGDKVTIGSADVSYRAIWRDAYTIDGLYNGNLPTLDEDENTVYETALGATVTGSNIPVVVKATSVTGIKNATPAAALDSATLTYTGDSEYAEDITLALHKDYTSYSDAVELSGNTLKGLKEGTVKLTATWTKDGKTWTKDSGSISIGKGYELKVSFAKNGTAITKLEMEAGTEPLEVEPVVVRSTKTSAEILSATTHHVEWKSTGAGVGVKAITETPGFGNGKISGLVASTTPVNVELVVTDENGIKNTTAAVLPVTVGAAAYTMEFLPSITATSTIDKIEAQANQNDSTSLTDATKFYVRTLDKDGKMVTNGKWEATADASDKVLVTASAVAAESTGSKLMEVTIKTKNVIDAGTLTVTFTSTDGVKYVKDMPVETYATIRMKAPNAKTATTDYVVTVGGTEVTTRDSDKKSYTDLHLLKAAGTLNKSEVVTSFDKVDLSAYSMVYKDTNTVALQKEFKRWKYGTSTYYTTSIDSVKLSSFTNGIYTIEGEMDAKVNISGLPGTITLSDDSSEAVVVLNNIEVSPVTGTEGLLSFDTDKVNLFKYDASGNLAPATDVTAKTQTVSPGTVTNGVRKDSVSFGKYLRTAGDPKAGMATLVFYTTNPAKGQTVTLYINGLDTTDGVTSYYEQGQKVKNAARKVGTTTYYFDEDGAQVTGTKLIELNGKKVLIVGGVVSPSGRQTYLDDWYYIGEGGEVQYGWLTAAGATATAATGVYYADPATGILATAGVTTVDGKNYYFGAESRKAVASSSANTYENVAGTIYYVNASGEVAMSGIFQMTGVDRLFREDGRIVSYADTDVDQTTGEITVADVKYIISKADDSAKLAERFYMVGSPAWTWAWGTSDPQSAEEAVARRTAGNEPTARVAITLKGENGTDDKLEYDATTAVKVAVKGNAAHNTATATEWLYDATVSGELPAFYKDNTFATTVSTGDIKDRHEYLFEKFVLDGDPVWTWSWGSVDPEDEDDAKGRTAGPVATVTIKLKGTKDTSKTEEKTYTSADGGVTVSIADAAKTADAWTYTAAVKALWKTFFKSAADTTPVAAASITNTKVYEFDRWYIGKLAVGKDIQVTQGFPKAWSKSSAIPVVKYDVTLTSQKHGTTKKVTGLTADVAPKSVSSGDAKVVFTATADLSQYYGDKACTTAAPKAYQIAAKTYTFPKGGDEGKAQAETPAKEGSEEDISWNLFYTTYDDGVGSLDIGYTGDVSGFAAKNPKASKYYKMNGDGTISLLANLAAADRKKAASAANSLITMDLADNGVFAYQLPVSYAAPSLKLTATSGSIKKNGGEQTVSTIVTEKKSTGAFEPLEVTTEDLTYAGATLGLGDNAGEVTFTTSAKASGKLAVKLSGWSSPVQVSYSIREVNKDVLTATAKGLVVKQTVLNNTATAAGEAQEIQIAVNGAEPTADAPVTVKAPNKDGGFKLTAGGEDLTKGGTLTSGTLSVEYPESPASMKAGTYTYKLTTANKGSLNVKVVVNKNALSKAVTLKQTAKMNLVTGQSLVLVPTLKGVTGTIEDVSLSDTDANTFAVEFSEEKNEIVLSPAAEDMQLSTKTTYQPTINITVGGVECPIPVKFKPVATKPAVKLTKVTLSKSAAAAATAEAPVAGTCNIVSTYKLGGKTIGQAWESIKIGGTAVEQGTPVTDTKTGLQVTYNEDGTLTVAAVAPTSKTVKNKGSIKVTVVYKNGVEVTKSLSVALK